MFKGELSPAWATGHKPLSCIVMQNNRRAGRKGSKAHFFLEIINKDVYYNWDRMFIFTVIGMFPMDSRRELVVFSVFISSPGDVEEERKRARKAVERVNSLVAKYKGIQLEAIGWEEIPIGVADRTQTIINPYVEKTDIFIGILNKRFGTPTSRAESGTEEEYNIIYERSRSTNPPIAAKLFFKKLKNQEISDPGTQLSKLLEFKSKVQPTSLYYEYKTVEELGKRIEEELAYVVHGIKRLSKKDNPEVRALSETEIRVLSDILEEKNGLNTGEQKRNADQIESAIIGLSARGLTEKNNDRIVPVQTMKSFLSIVKLLFEAERQLIVLQSSYYKAILPKVFKELIATRFHCDVKSDFENVIKCLLLLSPSAVEYALFGDTELYDKSYEMGAVRKQMEFVKLNNFQNVFHRLLLKYGEDCIEGRTLSRIDEYDVSANVFTVRVGAAHGMGLIFLNESTIPVIRAKAGSDLKKGEPVYANSDMVAYSGTMMMTLMQDEMALKSFDLVLAMENPSKEALIAANNNKGLILLRKKDKVNAALYFKQALILDPENQRIRNNLILAEKED